MTEVLEGGNFDAIDDGLATDYVHGGGAMFPAMGAMISGIRFNTVNLVAEGYAVVARFTSEITLATGKKLVRRGLAFYRLANGRIV